MSIRKKDHLKSFNNMYSRMYNYKLYKAMRKYGSENFIFELIEKCDNDLLDQKEQYYIELYDSKNNGYNEAIGGRGKPLWTSKQIEACKILYENNWLLKDIADLFNSCPSTVGKKLRETYNIDTKNNANRSCEVRIYAEDNKNILHFDSLTKAGQYIIDNNICKTTKKSCVISKISDALKNTNRTAYGFNWYYEDAS